MTAIFDLLNDILDCAEDEIDTPVCRRIIYPGGRPPSDVCDVSRGRDGQLWVANTGTQLGWPAPDGTPTTCASPLNETIILGILRCQRGSIQDGNNLPDESLVNEDSQRQSDDKAALLRALLCCSQIDGMNLIVNDWSPIPPRGKCVGGEWSFNVRIGGCGCQQES